MDGDLMAAVGDYEQNLNKFNLYISKTIRELIDLVQQFERDIDYRTNRGSLITTNKDDSIERMKVYKEANG